MNVAEIYPVFYTVKDEIDMQTVNDYSIWHNDRVLNYLKRLFIDSNVSHSQFIICLQRSDKYLYDKLKESCLKFGLELYNIR